MVHYFQYLGLQGWNQSLYKVKTWKNMHNLYRKNAKIP